MALVLALIGSLVGTMATPSPARAELTFGVAPSRIDLEADSGATGSQTLTVANDGDEGFDVSAVVQPYKGATGERSAVDWLTVEPASFRLEPGTEQSVEVSIRVPDDLDAGGRYAAVAFTTGAREAAGGAAMAGQIAVPFLIAVDGRGDLTRRASLARFAPVLAWDGRVGFVAVLRNDGNRHLFPAGTVEIGPVGGDPIGRLDLSPTTALLPDSDIAMPAQGAVPLAANEEYRAVTSVDYGGDELATAAVEFVPVAALAVASSGVCENLDRGPTARITLRNDGQLGLQPVVQVAVVAADGSVVASAVSPEPPTVWPGGTADVVVDLPERLLSGDYALAVRADYAPPAADGATFLPPVETSTSFAIGGLGGAAAPLCPPPTEPVG